VPHPFFARLRIVLEMIKIEHTLFALPFAFLGALLGARGLPSGRHIVWILVAMVGARSAAMAFNRLVDRHLDARNPRTAGRALPAGLVSVPFVWAFTVVASLLLVLAAWQLNPLALILSPVALGIAFFYSYTKRFTAWSHAFLGLALSVAPVGAWVAVRGDLRWEAAQPVYWLAAAVVCWLIGFDTIYALQDVDFDRSHGLHSLPARFGPSRALGIGRAFHALMIVCLTLVGVSAGLGAWYFAGVVIAAVLIACEHALIRPDDLRRLNVAFFNLNIAVSAELLLFAALDLWR
jgi:4-hydroxybenzoate polyprenyltransferase